MMGNPLPFAVLGELAGMKVEKHTPWRADRWKEPRQPLTTAVPGYTGTAVVPFRRRIMKLVLQSCTAGCLSSVSMMKAL